VDVYGLRIVDMGGGVGKFTVAAMINGAGSAIGYELPGNIAQKLIFDAATSRIQLPTTRPAQWIPKDIDEVFFLFIK
jgi:predicted RNA methylase